MTRAGFEYVPGHRRGADERNGANPGMREQCVYAIAAAMHEVENSLGQTRLIEQLREQYRRERHFLAGLKHEGVAAGEGEREHP
jgi:hypothetical protein